MMWIFGCRVDKTGDQQFVNYINFLNSSFHRVLYVVCFLLGNYLASGNYPKESVHYINLF